jgi:hypothetical protein
MRQTIALALERRPGPGFGPDSGPPTGPLGELGRLVRLRLDQRGLTAVDHEAWVFAWASGAHLSYSAWRKHWVRAVKGAGLPDRFGFHDLRRANATGLVSSGVDIRTAQSRLGHADVRMTLEVYARATTEADRAAAEAIGRLFDPDRIEGPAAAAHSARDGRGTEANRGISRGRRGTRANRGPASKKPQADDLRLHWSGGGDLNSRPLRPERSALPS